MYMYTVRTITIIPNGTIHSLYWLKDVSRYSEKYESTTIKRSSRTRKFFWYNKTLMNKLY